jgi:hypothetical protein
LAYAIPAGFESLRISPADLRKEAPGFRCAGCGAVGRLGGSDLIISDQSSPPGRLNWKMCGPASFAFKL